MVKASSDSVLGKPSSAAGEPPGEGGAASEETLATRARRKAARERAKKKRVAEERKAAARKKAAAKRRRAQAQAAPKFEAWQRRFLKALTKFASVSHAARVSKVSRQNAYKVKAKDEAFAEAWEDAHDQAIDALIEAAFIRAKRSYKSDRLAMFLLQAHRPEVYGERVEVSGGVTLHWDLLPLDPEELAKRLGPEAMRLLLERLQRAVSQSPS